MGGRLAGIIGLGCLLFSGMLPAFAYEGVEVEKAFYDGVDREAIDAAMGRGAEELTLPGDAPGWLARRSNNSKRLLEGSLP